jgi:hypothetical protein
MPEELELLQIIGALSARMIALEGAVAALSLLEGGGRTRVLAKYDAFAAELLERYGGLPVAEQYLETLRQSFADIRALLRSGTMAEASGQNPTSQQP